MPTYDSLVQACCRGIASTPWRLLRPRPRDERLLAHITDVGPPDSTVMVRVRALPQASTGSPTVLMAEGVWRPWRTKLGMTSFVVEHPRARFLVDAAICTDVHSRVLVDMPAVVRMAVKPGRTVTGMPEALGHVGLSTGDVEFVIATHLHWDHVSGLLDLDPAIPLRVAPAEADSFRGAAGTVIGVVREPLRDANFEPFDLEARAVSTFTRSHDLFGDGSVIIVDLPGHTPGSIGVLLATESGPVLLAGDAAWHTLQIESVREKAPFPGALVDHDREAAFHTLHRLHAAARTVAIVPGHDREAAARLA